MTQTPGTVERAYQLAKAGSCRSIDDIVRQLTAERHESPQAHLAGKSLRLELRRLLKARYAAAPADPSGPRSGTEAAL
jgi:hypothetical protein